jgi:hypothetical protein
MHGMHRAREGNQKLAHWNTSTYRKEYSNLKLAEAAIGRD